MALPSAAVGSLIAALHARYEATQTEYATVERAETNFRRQAKNGDTLRYADRCRTACMTLDREANALRDAILYQVPDSWSDALILQFHIVCAHDMYAAASERCDADDERLQLAIDTLFDFMCREVRAEAGEIGAAFKDAAAEAFRARRLRTGVVEA